MKNKRIKQNKPKEKMTTILEEESDEEDHITNKQQSIKQESEEETSNNTEGKNWQPEKKFHKQEKCHTDVTRLNKKAAYNAEANDNATRRISMDKT